MKLQKILVAEDSPTQREEIRFLLEENGFDVLVASNGRQAFDMARSEHPALVITDVVMPEMTGFELTRAMRADVALQETPVILVTSLTSANDVFLGLECGANSFITKPYEESHLLSRINYIFRNQQPTRNEGPSQEIEIDIGGERSSITAGRKQILDMLVSTYDQAVRLNGQLELNNRRLLDSYDTLNALYGLSRKLNGCKTSDEVLQFAVEQIETLPEMDGCWIVIVDDAGAYRIVQSSNQPLGDAPATVLNADFEVAPESLGASADLIVTAPLVSENVRIGALSALRRGGAVANGGEHEVMATIGQQVVVTLERIHLLENLEALVTQRTEALRAEMDERRRIQEQLNHAQKMEAVGSLTGGIAHDFNNLLSVVIGNLEVMKLDMKLDGEAKDVLESALDSATHGADLTRQLLAFARKQTLEPKRVGVNEFLTNIAKLLGRTLGTRIQIELELCDDPWPCFVDPAQLDSAVMNLSVNARDAMPDGGRITIRTRNTTADELAREGKEDPKAGDYLVVEVSDTGSGMPEAVMKRIFDPFFTTKEQGKGTGLGLAMVYGFINQSGGHVSVYSEEGRGTTFRLYLPKAPDDAVSADGDRATNEAVPRGDGERILIVEDNDALRKIAERQLARLGYATVAVDSSKAALATLERDPDFDLVFSDIMMPGGMNGHELILAVLERWPSMHVLLTSGHSELDQEDMAELPADILSKPYNRADLARKIHAALH